MGAECHTCGHDLPPYYGVGPDPGCEWCNLRADRDHYRQGWATLANQVEQAIRWSVVDEAEPMVAISSLRRFLTDYPPPKVP